MTYHSLSMPLAPVYIGVAAGAAFIVVRSFVRRSIASGVREPVQQETKLDGVSINVSPKSRSE
jgi:hypothetical protein